MYLKESILIYIGANKGDGLLGLLKENSFTKAYVFEPDPEMYNILYTRYAENIDQYRKDYNINTHLFFLNLACSNEIGKRTLYVFDNRVSTSLGNFVSDPSRIIKTIEIEAINLYDFLIREQVYNIDYLLTDAQGSDLSILTTIKPYIDEKKIRTIYCETQNDKNQWYEGLDNGFSKFKDLLSNNYEISFFDDHYNGGRHTDQELLNNSLEWDTCWVVKK